MMPRTTSRTRVRKRPAPQPLTTASPGRLAGHTGSHGDQQELGAASWASTRPPGNSSILAPNTARGLPGGAPRAYCDLSGEPGPEGLPPPRMGGAGGPEHLLGPGGAGGWAFPPGAAPTASTRTPNQTGARAPNVAKFNFQARGSKEWHKPEPLTRQGGPQPGGPVSPQTLLPSPRG